MVSRSLPSWLPNSSIVILRSRVFPGVYRDTGHRTIWLIRCLMPPLILPGTASISQAIAHPASTPRYGHLLKLGCHRRFLIQAAHLFLQVKGAAQRCTISVCILPRCSPPLRAGLGRFSHPFSGVVSNMLIGLGSCVGFRLCIRRCARVVTLQVRRSTALSLWHAMLGAPGFGSPFADWWPCREIKLACDPIAVPAVMPTLQECHSLFLSFQANVEAYERVLTRTRCREAILRRKQQPMLIF